MECAKIDLNTSDDIAEFYTVKKRKARKQHKCGECNRIIEIGEVYESYFSVCDNTRYTFYHKTCNDCLVIRKVFYEDFSYYYGEIFADIHDFYFRLDEIPESCLSQLTQRGKDYFFTRIEQEWIEQEMDENDTI